MTEMFEPRVNMDNPEPRAACALLLDTSGSMQGGPIYELNNGLQRFSEDLKEDPLARKRTEVMIVTFGGAVSIATPFQEAQHFEAPTLYAGGGTPLGQAVVVALEQLSQQKEAYKQNGLEYFRPWLIVMSDGSPTDDRHTVKRAVESLEAMQRKKGITVFPVGVGDHADMKFLSKLSVERSAVALRDITSFSEFFKWLSKSLGQVSASSTQVSNDDSLTQTAQVPLPSPEGWLKA